MYLYAGNHAAADFHHRLWSVVLAMGTTSNTKRGAFTSCRSRTTAVIHPQHGSLVSGFEMRENNSRNATYTTRGKLVTYLGASQEELWLISPSLVHRAADMHLTKALACD